MSKCRICDKDEELFKAKKRLIAADQAEVWERSRDQIMDIKKVTAELTRVHGFNVKPRTALQAIQAGVEIAGCFGVNVAQACKALSKTLGDMEKHAKAFRHVGVSLKWWEKLYIRICLKFGLQLKAQRYILNKLGREFPGLESEK